MNANCETCRLRRESGRDGSCARCQADEAKAAREADRLEARREAQNRARCDALTARHELRRETPLTDAEALAIYLLWRDERRSLQAADEHVLDVAERLERKPATVAMTTAHYTHLDTAGRDGLSNCGHAVLTVWEAFELAVAS